MELSPLYHNTRPDGELLPQEAAAFDLLEQLGIDYDRVSSEPADTMETVSYTHLYVYKRQGSVRFVKYFFQVFSNFFVLHF